MGEQDILSDTTQGLISVAMPLVTAHASATTSTKVFMAEKLFVDQSFPIFL
jgi:hypothetical protein